MKQHYFGLLVGVIVGLIDVTPMILMKMTWDANLSAFTHWVILGYLISIINLRLKSYLKGLFISVLTMIPIAFLAWWSDYSAVIPMSASTIIFGLLMGFIIDRHEE